MEAKYNSSKLVEMIDQLKKDHFIISNVKTKSLNGNIPTHNFRNLKLDFDCIIISIKKYNFFDRDIRKFYDWGLIQRVIEMKNEIADIKNENVRIKNEIVDAKNEIADIKYKISALKSGFQELKKKLELINRSMSIKRNNLRKIKKKETKEFTKQKRKRDKIDNNDLSDS